MRALAVVLASSAVLGCGSGSGCGSSPTPSSGPDQAVLLITNQGGLEPVENLLVRYPTFALYADGRVIVHGPQDAIYPGPALPNLQVLRLSPAGVEMVVQGARDAGLMGRDRLLHADGVIDAPATVFQLSWDGATHRTTAEALFAVSPVTAEHAALQALVARVQDLRSWLGDEIASDEQPYEPTAMRLIVRAADPAQGPDPQFARIVDWPLAAPLGSFGAEVVGGLGGRCGVVLADDLATVFAAAQVASQLTYWRSAGSTFSVAFRPLYPLEDGCQVA